MKGTRGFSACLARICSRLSCNSLTNSFRIRHASLFFLLSSACEVASRFRAAKAAALDGDFGTCFLGTGFRLEPPLDDDEPRESDLDLDLPPPFFLSFFLLSSGMLADPSAPPRTRASPHSPHAEPPPTRGEPPPAPYLR